MQIKVLMVCLGNICRSPLAEGILKTKVDPDKVFVDSAGTAGYHIGSQPDPRSIAVAGKYNIDITDQRCRIFTKEDLNVFDLIYAMDHHNYSDIIRMATLDSQVQKVRLLLDEVEMDLREVPDPYYGGEQGFEFVFDLVDKACDAVVKRITEIEDQEYGSG